ncbi:LacI family DNA-binding transcriptional regulator [uncultured Vagococcus sp.]|uniref:LacI family DNA-binding transcriptional regulator n=1 Tax=uncultured Vagococcus sp. TaxID=189676 RepID=UPI0028D4955E|nr:LacI family DNA-binding transcriptional regulator [uncultured Vagococcus sp.]
MATIKDVAKLANVSVATVSRYMNSNGYVSEKAAKQVAKAIETLDYQPNEVARSLFQKKSKLIGLLIPDITNPFFPLLAKGIEDGLNDLGYTLILGNVEENERKQESYLSTFINNQVAGVISASFVRKPLLKGIPYVVVDRISQRDKYSVASDDFLGGKLAAEAVLETGFKRVTVMVGPRELPGSEKRLAGIEHVFLEHGVSYQLFETKTFEFGSGTLIAQELFEKFPETDTVIASNDVFALSVIHEARKRGLSVPEDLQIIGYDDIPFSAMTYPQLTTISQPAYELGIQAANLLHKVIEDETYHKENIVLPVQFVERQTLRKKNK